MAKTCFQKRGANIRHDAAYLWLQSPVVYVGHHFGQKILDIFMRFGVLARYWHQSADRNGGSSCRRVVPVERPCSDPREMRRAHVLQQQLCKPCLPWSLFDNHPSPRRPRNVMRQSRRA